MMQFAWFDHAGVAVAELSLDADIPPLLPEERPFVAGAVASRAREFAAGRDCARRALSVLGLAPGAIPVADDRLPIWPHGIVGSITHGGGHCAAAAARSGWGVMGIGIDLEPAQPIDADLVGSICRKAEIDWLSAQSAADRLLLARVIFSAKECAYKCLYPVSRAPLEFEDLSVGLDLARGRFVATLQLATPPFAAGYQLAGGFRISASHIACAAILGEAVVGHGG